MSAGRRGEPAGVSPRIVDDIFDRPIHTKLKGLILAQNERWRRGLGMQVERDSPQGEESGERERNT